MVDDRKRRSVHGVTFNRPGTSPGTPVGDPRAPADEIDEGPTPLPVNAEEAHSWQHVGARVSRLELQQQSSREWLGRVETLVDEFAIPSLKKLMGQIDELLQRQERNSTRLETFFDEQWPDLCEAVDLLGERLERVERKQDNFVRELALHNDRIARAEKRLDDLERQLGTINLERRDQSVITAERRRWFSWGKAAYPVVAGLFAAAGYLASRLNLF